MCQSDALGSPLRGTFETECDLWANLSRVRLQDRVGPEFAGMVVSVDSRSVYFNRTGTALLAM